MANKLINIKQIDTSGEAPTSIVLKVERVHKVPIAQSAPTAQNAAIVQYASSDTSKGTIEQRLTNLGY